MNVFKKLILVALLCSNTFYGMELQPNKISNSLLNFLDPKKTSDHTFELYLANMQKTLFSQQDFLKEEKL